MGGFQGFAEDMSVSLAPITLIFGPNGAGKSSILRAIRLLQQSIQGSPYTRRNSMFTFEGDEVSLVSFANVVHRHDLGDKIRLGVSVSEFAPISERVTALGSILEQIDVEWEISSPGQISSVSFNFIFRNSLGAMNLYFEAAERELTLVAFENESLLEEVALAQSRVGTQISSIFTELDEEIDEEGSNYFMSSSDDDWDEVLDDCRFQLSGIFPTIAHQRKDLVSKKQAQLVRDVLSFVRISVIRQISGTQFVGPLRNIAERITFDAGNQPFTNTDARFAESEIRTNQAVSSWLNRLTGGRYDYRTVNYRPADVDFLGDLKSELIVDNLTHTHVTFSDVGVGLSQVLPILQALNLANRRMSTSQAPILIEQPELHLHPRMQADLMELFVELSTASPGLQIIAESHSEAMLLRLQKLLRDGKISPDAVSIIYVDQMDKTNFVSNVPLMKSNDYEVQLPVSFAGLRLRDLL
jgi:predicted ATP-dependent endonuclease of OLD family